MFGKGKMKSSITNASRWVVTGSPKRAYQLIPKAIRKELEARSLHLGEEWAAELRKDGELNDAEWAANAASYHIGFVQGYLTAIKQRRG